MMEFIRIYSVDAPTQAYVDDVVSIKVYLVTTIAIPTYSKVRLKYNGSILESIAMVSPAWRFQFSIPQMPNKSISVEINAYYWSSNKQDWVLDDTKTISITLAVPIDHKYDIWTPTVAMLSMVMLIGMMAMMTRGIAGGMRE